MREGCADGKWKGFLGGEKGEGRTDGMFRNALRGGGECNMKGSMSLKGKKRTSLSKCRI